MTEYLIEDMIGTDCAQCKKSTYTEVFYHDDMDGKVTCSLCHHQISHYKITKIGAENE